MRHLRFSSSRGVSSEMESDEVAVFKYASKVFASIRRHQIHCSLSPSLSHTNKHKHKHAQTCLLCRRDEIQSADSICGHFSRQKECIESFDGLFFPPNPTLREIPASHLKFLPHGAAEVVAALLELCPDRIDLK